jgi:fumarate reductase subunit C
MPESTTASRSPVEGTRADTAAQRRIAEARAWYLQRISAMVLTLFVIIHLAVMVFAIHGGLSAAEILSRTQSSPLVGIFYGLFVIACAVHVPIGVAKIAEEWGAMSAGAAKRLSQVFAAVILITGFAAVWGVS